MSRAETAVSPALLRGLELGSVVEAGQFAPGLCDEKFCYVLVAIKPEKNLFEFEANAFGIYMFTAFAKITPDNKILWELEQ